MDELEIEIKAYCNDINAVKQILKELAPKFCEQKTIPVEKPSFAISQRQNEKVSEK